MRRSAQSAVRLVAIVGGSGSGKSWVAERLQARLGERTSRLALDDFYRDRSDLPLGRRVQVNYDHPRAIDWATFERVLRKLSTGSPVRVPSYDFATHSRRPNWRIVRPGAIILVEGLWLLRRPTIRHLFALKLFLECPQRLRLRRRLDRDCQARGRSAASVRRQFRSMVCPMHKLYVEPQRRRADIVLGPNRSSADLDRLCIIIQNSGAQHSTGVSSPALRRWAENKKPVLLNRRTGL